LRKKSGKKLISAAAAFIFKAALKKHKKTGKQK
jgi:hypothetical protein